MSLHPQCFNWGHTCRPRYYAKLASYARIRILYARGLHSAPSENIAGDTHLASQNNYGKLEQVLYKLVGSSRAARVWFRDYIHSTNAEALLSATSDCFYGAVIRTNTVDLRFALVGGAWPGYSLCVKPSAKRD